MQKMKKSKLWRRAAGILAAAVIVIMGILFFESRRVTDVSASVPEETADVPDNPGCGLYHIYGFTVGEDNTEKLRLMEEDRSSLCLLELNLRKYRDEDLPKKALRQIDDLLSSVNGTGKKFIVRFLYDWDGTASLTEPDSIEIILRHMEQAGPLLVKNEDNIYTMQGLFTGNWGEMNGSRFSDEKSLRALFEKLKDVTKGKIRLSVRTPQQWRIIQGVSEDDLADGALEELAEESNLGLFNDGLTGSATDYGTYAADPSGLYESRTDKGLKKFSLRDFDPEESWPRDPELAFQETVCRAQPCGGEAIHVCEWNDLTQAIRSFRRMHISYLDADYDSSVWEKWAAQAVSEEGVFDGLRGDDYIRAHLGYRYVLKDASLRYSRLRNTISFSLSVANKGFAPSYEEMTANIRLLDDDGNTVRKTQVPFDTGKLPGGVEDQKTEVLKGKIPAKGLRDGTYYMSVEFTDQDGNTIRTGNRGALFGTVAAW